MIQNIKELLQNTQLQQQVKETTNLGEVIKLIANAARQRGYSFTQESLAQAIGGLMLEDRELTEADLLAVSGSRWCCSDTTFDTTKVRSCLYAVDGIC
ncbi:MAG: Nif11 family protein [Pseudanabaena sp. CRU_2_10]|nr:Nif11 family protein [Pseudanabaena sp. CRU_2_10]